MGRLVCMDLVEELRCKIWYRLVVRYIGGNNKGINDVNLVPVATVEFIEILSIPRGIHGSHCSNPAIQKERKKNGGR